MYVYVYVYVLASPCVRWCALVLVYVRVRALVDKSVSAARLPVFGLAVGVRLALCGSVGQTGGGWAYSNPKPTQFRAEKNRGLCFGMVFGLV